MTEERITGGGQRFFPQVKYFVDHYAPPGIEDQRAAHVFVDCETTEAITTLRNELRAISNGNYDSNTLDRTIGKGRVSKYSSYDNWAKLMILWLASYKG